MDELMKQSVKRYLDTLVNQPLRYAIKSPDTELYDFGFGELVKVFNRQGQQRIVGEYSLHVLCRFKVIQKNGEHKIEIFYEDTPCEIFHSAINQLVGLKIKRVQLSDKNDLWLDFGDYWIVFATYENGEESWRYFAIAKDSPHLVASDSWINFS